MIRTERLRLVPVTPANAGALWEVLQAPDLRSYQDLPDIGRAQFVRLVSSRPRRLGRGSTGRFEWLMQVGASLENGPVGWVSLRVTEASPSSGEIGYSVVRAHRGRGFASEAVAALIDEAFRQTRLRRLRAYCLPENVASRAVLRRSGFKDEGKLPHGATVQGQPVDVIVHSLERERWEAEPTKNRAATQS